jgi:hypothetical protein
MRIDTSLDSYNTRIIHFYTSSVKLRLSHVITVEVEKWRAEPKRLNSSVETSKAVNVPHRQSCKIAATELVPLTSATFSLGKNLSDVSHRTKIGCQVHSKTRDKN